MCGRFSLATSKEKIHSELPFVDTSSNIKNNYNVVPTQHAYVVANDNPERLQYMTWGLIPYWSKEGKNGGKLINARMEGIECKPSFRVPIRRRRCLVLADSFYEWRREGGRKVPYRIFMNNGRLLVMAGIWDLWYSGNYDVKSFSIITCPANEDLATVHNRMPVLLPKLEDCKKWLEEGETDLNNILPLLQTALPQTLKMYRVSEQVNSVRNNSSVLHYEVPEVPTLFD